MESCIGLPLTHRKLVAFNSLASLSKGIIVNKPWYRHMPITRAFGSIAAINPPSERTPTLSETFPLAFVTTVMASPTIRASSIITLKRRVNINSKSFVLSGGRKCFITVIFPLMLISFKGRKPSGVTKSISTWLLRAITKFRSVADVKFPEINAS